MRKFLLLLVASILALTTIHTPYAEAAERAVQPASTVTATRVPHTPLMMRLVNCEEYDIQPCWTFDDGAYRLVTSYDPYYSIKIRTVCKAEDGGPIVPCISKRNNRVAKGAPITRNLFI